MDAMGWIIAAGLFVFLVVLAAGFMAAALALRQDVSRRFDQLRIRLEREANTLIRPMLSGENDGERPGAIEKAHPTREG
jgi:hypothetical protein